MFHPFITIEVNKSYLIRLNSGKKSQSEVNKMLRDLSEDKTHWSSKVMNAINTIINKNNYNIPRDFLEVRFNNIKSVNYEFKDKLESLNSKDIIKEMHNVLDNTNVNNLDEVTIQTNPKYSSSKDKDNNVINGFDDIQMAQIILLLSELAKNSDTLWLSIIMKIKEIGKGMFYFINEDGHIDLSKRIKINDTKLANEYIRLMNDIIDGKRTIPMI